ncbi:MAG: response regulator [Betaproteobacteria bacterium]|nr:response regulator [Betaproteobacteria bacterium]MDH5211556.1 response regulator [Betaproteobacteria bacterium]MDH5576930.1 response regulator [Betaproteobacteria bacterium]
MASGAKRRNVLIVDDHEPTRLLIGRIVTQELGARVTLAGTCEEALRLAEHTAYDVILLDLLMPGIGGYEVLRLMREQGANRATPILVVSVMSTHESRERCRLLGATAFLAKPVDRELVTTMLRSLLGPRPADRLQPENGTAQHGNGC